MTCHNPYFSRWFSAICITENATYYNMYVTILILVEGFLQYAKRAGEHYAWKCHNPYFSRWFSAITKRMY